MKRVFLSYARDDKPVAEEVAVFTRQAGHEVWLDRELGGGEEWWDEIIRQIVSSDVMLFLVSGSSVTSEACRSELTYAVELGKAIVPITVDDVAIVRAPPPIPDRNALPYRSGEAALGFPIVGAVTIAQSQELVDPLPRAPDAPGAYMVSLIAKVATEDELTGAEQLAIIQEFRSAYNKPGKAKPELANAMAAFRDRRDLHADNRELIGDLLRRYSGSGDAAENQEFLAQRELEALSLDERSAIVLRHEESPDGSARGNDVLELAVQLDDDHIHRLVYVNEGGQVATVSWDGAERDVSKISGLQALKGKIDLKFEVPGESHRQIVLQVSFRTQKNGISHASLNWEGRAGWTYIFDRPLASPPNGTRASSV